MDVPSLLVAVRPWQWLKNGLLLAPLVFARRFDDPSDVGTALLAYLAFCLISSAGYLWNDVCDREADRRHPSKALRPIAAGVLRPRTALWVAGLLVVAGAAVAARVAIPGRELFLALALAYAVLTASYSAVLKRLPYFDVVIIAVGFLLRVYAGGAAIDVVVSRWLMSCTFFGAVYVGLGKRIAERRAIGELTADTRAALSGYADRPLRLLTVAAGTALLAAYAAYTVADRTVLETGGYRLTATVPFALIGVLRYAVTIRRGSDAEDPARLFLRDPWLLLTSLGWSATVAWALSLPAGSP